MSHDLYASWVTAELSSLFKSDTEILFKGQSISSSQITSFANRESGRRWPIPDGRISISLDLKEIEVALELKRTNEGLHGVLTATGQSQAYLKKGYDISVIAVPDEYVSYENPGPYLKALLDSVNPNSNIVVVTYSPPDETKPSPFKGRLTIHRDISFDRASINASRVREFNANKASTQWAHLREGSSDAHCFFKYLQIAKNVSATENYCEKMYVSAELQSACDLINPNISAIKFLSNASGEALHDYIWRKYWFDYVITSDMQKIWKTNALGQKEAINFDSKLKSDANTYKKFFGGKSNSTKNKLVEALNSGSSSKDILKAASGEASKKILQLDANNKIDLSTISFEELAWIIFALNIHHRAHSFREDVDSGLSHIGMLEDDGRPSDSGYRFVDISERTNDCYSGNAFQLYGKAILTEGQLASFLHYVHRISDEIFSNDPLFSSTRIIENDTIKFNHEEYLLAVKSVMARDLCVINLAAERGGVSRKPFQAELAILQKLEIIPKARHKRFRLGGGLMINWPKLSEYFEI